MSSLQSLREFISERLAAAAEEIFRHCEGTIVQYEEELCRQRRLLDIIWKPQLQLHHIVLPQHHVLEEEDVCNRQMNFRVEQKEPGPPQTENIKQKGEPPQIKEEQEEQEPPPIKEEQQEQEPSQIKEEQEELCISQDKEQLKVIQETDTMMEIPTYEKNEDSEADLKYQQNFNVTVGQNEGSQHETSISTTDEEAGLQNSDQKKRRDRSHVQSVASSHISESLRDSDESKKPSLIKTCKQSPKENRLFSVKSSKRTRIAQHMDVKIRTGSDETLYVCEECGTGFGGWSLFRNHMGVHTGEKRWSRKICDKSFSQTCSLNKHLRIHKTFSCNVCGRSFSNKTNLRTHKRTHTGEKPYCCRECGTSFRHVSSLKRHTRTHTGEKPFSCNVCGKSFRNKTNLRTHKRTHTGEKPYCCRVCGTSFRHASSLKRHTRTHTGEKPFFL